MSELINRPNVLLAKVGRFGVGPEAVAKAEAALRDMAADFEVWMESELLKLEQARSACRSEPDSAQARSSIYRSAHDLKGMGSTYGYPLVTRVAASLTRLLDEEDGRGSRQWMSLVNGHVDAIQAIVRHRHRDQADPVGTALATELEKQVARTWSSSPARPVL